MSLFIVSYDLCQPGRNYQPVYTYLQSLGGKRLMESLWAISAAQTVSTIRDSLVKLIDPNDRILVVQIDNDWYAPHNAMAAGLQIIA